MDDSPWLQRFTVQGLSTHVHPKVTCPVPELEVYRLFDADLRDEVKVEQHVGKGSQTEQCDRRYEE